MNIQFNIKNICPVSEVLCNPDLHKSLKKHGIFLGYFENPDLTMEMANGLKKVKPGTIAFEKLDGCQIKNKHLLKNDNLLLLVKSYKYSNYEINNLSCAEGRIFTRFLTDDLNETKHITRDEFKKVVLGLSFLHYSRHDRLIEYAKKPKNKTRSIDVSFAGTTAYYNKHGSISGTLVEQHRMACIDKINRMNLVTQTAADRTLSRSDYYTELMNTKIVVSPWGWGESCYRDYEAIALGCELIKPNSFKIATNPDIYNSEFMSFCRADFLNLNEIVADILSKYEERELNRFMNIDYLIACRSINYQTHIIKSIINLASKMKKS